jgi:hypothetical protein
MISTKQRTEEESPTILKVVEDRLDFKVVVIAEPPGLS